VCDLAILCEDAYLPDKSAKICYQHQRDFNYLEIRHLWEDAKTDSKGIHIAGMNYGLVIIDSLSIIPPEAISSLKALAMNGRLIINKHTDFSSLFKGAKLYQTPDNLVEAIDKKIIPDLSLTTPSEDIRYRHVVKETGNYYIIFNEGSNVVSSKLRIATKGNRQLLNPANAEALNLGADENVSFKPHELKIVMVTK
jgi:hypothetical protein